MTAWSGTGRAPVGRRDDPRERTSYLIAYASVYVAVLALVFLALTLGSYVMERELGTRCADDGAHGERWAEYKAGARAVCGGVWPCAECSVTR